MTRISALIDIGGSSVKVTICNNHARKIYAHEVRIDATYEKSHIFLNPSLLYNQVIEAMNSCAKKLPIGVKIDRIYISTLRQGFCLIEDRDETTPIYLNSDTSGESARQDIDKYGTEKIYKETGHWFAPQLTLPKLINLIKSNSKLIRKNTSLLFVHDWLVWKFTNISLTEMTLVSAGQLANLTTKDVNKDLLEFFGIPASLIPDPEKFNSEVGRLNSSLLSELSSHWSAAMVCVGGGDSHFLHMGASGNKVGNIVVSAGSSTPISLLSPSLGTSTVLQPWKSTSFVDSYYLLEGNLGYPGSFYGWLKKNVSRPITSTLVNMESLSKAPRVFGSCNMWNEKKWESRPAFSFMGDFSQASSSEMALGLTLDYSFALANQISALLQDGFEIHQVIITGGGANSQMQAILTGLLAQPVHVMSSSIAISNLFSILNGDGLENLEFEAASEILDDETNEFLRNQSKNHALVYEQIEGTRKVLENAR